MPAMRSNGSFTRTFWWVTLAHVLVVLVIGFWSLTPRTRVADVKFMDVVDPRGLKGEISPGPVAVSPEASGAANPAPAPAPAPKPQVEAPPAPKPTPRVEPVEPTPQPTAPKNDFSTAKPVKPKVTKVKVNLDKVVERPVNGSSATKTATKKTTVTASHANGEGDSLSEGELANRLGQSLSQAGVTGRVAITGSSAGGGGQGNGASSEFSAYFALISEQMHEAWEESVQYAGTKWIAVVEIVVERDGRISNVSLGKSSGNGAYDASVLAAARRVGQIRRPLPEGLDGKISINFKPGA